MELNKTEQELREKIDLLLFRSVDYDDPLTAKTWAKNLAMKILALIKEAGYVHSASEEGSEPTPISNAQSGEGAISNANIIPAEINKAEQELVEKIARVVSSVYFGLWDNLNQAPKNNWRQWVRERILPILDEAGYVKLKSVREKLGPMAFLLDEN